MVLSEMNNYRHKHWESLILVGLQNVQKVVILEEAHSSIGNLKMNTANALDDSLEQPWDKVFDLFDFTDLKDLLKLGQEKCFLDAVGKRPVLEQSFKKRNSQSSILGEEEHGASQQLLIELRACLNLMERNDNILEEDNVLISKWYSESTDDTCKDIKKLSSSIELVSLMNK